MTEDEIRLIVQITNGADSGCSVCSRDLAEKLTEAFPQFGVQIEAERKIGTIYRTAEQRKMDAEIDTLDAPRYDSSDWTDRP